MRVALRSAAVMPALVSGAGDAALPPSLHTIRDDRKVIG